MVDLVEKVLLGELRAIARAATQIENHAPGAARLLEQLRPHTGCAAIVGLTGAPGVGKSTLLDQLIACARRQSLSVAVIAVDPSSPISGGAVLGDRVRMQRHHADPGVFIRSMAARGALGGLASATEGLVTLFDASGRDVIFIETVGVGQSETGITALAQIVVVVLAPSMGDDIQTLKAGLLEVADLLVINKADLPGASDLEQNLEGLRAPLFRVSAHANTGVDELLRTILDQVRSKQVES